MRNKISILIFFAGFVSFGLTTLAADEEVTKSSTTEQKSSPESKLPEFNLLSTEFATPANNNMATWITRGDSPVAIPFDWNVYAEICNCMPSAEIRSQRITYILNKLTDDQKQRLFDQPTHNQKFKEEVMSKARDLTPTISPFTKEYSEPHFQTIVR
jgi:hypothetical protein